MIEPVVIPELLWGKDDGESSTDLYKIPFHSIGAGTAKKRSLRIKRAAASCASIDVAIQRSPTKYDMAKAAYPLALIWSDPNNASDNNATSPLSFARRRRYGNSELLLTDICLIASGRSTFAFQAFVTKHAKGEIPPESCCFSVIGKTRTLDFYANDTETASRWKVALQILLQNANEQPHPNSHALEKDWNQNLLFDAARNGDIATLRWCFDRGCPSDYVLSSNGDTCLLVACRLGLLDVARLMLLEYNARNDPDPNLGQTGLQLAVSSGHASIVQLILDCAAPTGLDGVISNHLDCNGEAPIHVACRCGSIQILERLIVGGAQVGVIDARGRTCLHLAAQQGNVSCLLCVLEAGGDEFIEVRCADGWKCLHLAIRANKIECVRVLLQTGAKVSLDATELASKKPRIFKLLLEYTPDVDESIDSYEGNESCSSSIESRGSTIFSGLNTYITSPELNQFQTPMSTEYVALDRDEYDAGSQFSYGDEVWTICLTDDGETYYYNNDSRYSTWEDPRHNRILFEQHPIAETQPRESKSGRTIEEGVCAEPPNGDNPHELPNHLPLHTGTIEESYEPTNDEMDPIDKLIAKPKLGRVSDNVNVTEVANNDPRSMLFAQIRARDEKSDAKSGNETKKSNIPITTNVHPKEMSIDPKQMLLSQIRTRALTNGSTDNEESKLKQKDELINDEKYRKMKAVGVPLPAILQRMSRDGLSDSTIQTFQQSMQAQEPKTLEANSSNVTPSSKCVIASPPRPCDNLKENLKKDESMSKYVNMKKVGIPAEAVVMKMKQDGMEEERITAFRAAYGLSFSSSSSSKKNQKTLPVGSMHRRSSKTLQKIHWKAINNDEKLRDSLWTSNVKAEVSEKQLKELESLFSASPRKTAAVAIKRGKAAPNRTSTTTFIETKRANNIAISLAQYTKAFSNFDDLVTAVASLDETCLDAERINNMMSLLPTTSELNCLKEMHDNDGLGRAEQFFVSVSKMPLFADKLLSFRYLLQFDEQLNELKARFNLLEKACDEVIGSKKLAFVCKKLLCIGNLMNESAGKSAFASGITLDSLCKISKKKGSDGKVTLIDHVVANEENADDLCFWDETPTLRECTRLDLDEMKLSLREIETGTMIVERTMISVQSEADSEDKRLKQCSNEFLSKMTPFSERARNELKAMNVLAEQIESKVGALKRFFAEEESSSAIFSVLLEFSRIVQTAKEAHHRKQRAMRRRESSLRRPQTATS